MKYFLLFTLCSLLFSCSKKKELTPAEVTAYEAEINTWHAKRIDDVKAPNGWVNLIGLYWLEPGINSFGSGEKNNIVFPKGTLPEKAGYFLVKENTVSLTVEKGVDILSNGAAITNGIIFHPDSTKNPQLAYGSLRWNIIKRDTKLGIRVRDLESKALTNFKEVERFTIDPQWRLAARFEKADSLKTIDVTNILGQTTAQNSPGAIVFEWEGKEYKLDALEGKDEFFIVFADATTGKETYGGGRFIYVKKPGADGNTIIDFNKAYNPPCVFSPYATCPLPPKQNVLPIEIKVGELAYHYDEAHALALLNK
jgi:uncharacterized protein (DUF1684 family)